MSINIIEQQVFPNPPKAEREAFELSEDIDDGIYNMRGLIQVVADCAHNNSVADGGGFIDGAAISITLNIALNSLKEIEQNANKLRELQVQREKEIKSLKRDHMKFKLNLLDEEEQRKVIKFAKSLMD